MRIPVRFALFAAFWATAGVCAAAAPVPVLLELFTSEGCSSCPPADTLLRMLARQENGPAHVIAMSEHVDYWDRLGWKDPFSSSQLTRRQQNYAARFRSQGPYTPQMVVDGVDEFVGNDATRAEQALAQAAEHPKLDIKAEFVNGDLHLTAPASASTADLWIAVTYDPEPSQVSRGENSGRKLLHISVVKSLARAGEITKTKGFDGRVPVILDARLKNARVAVFAQERDQGRVLGVIEISARQSAGNVARWSPQK